jgi:hypothetical protein
VLPSDRKRPVPVVVLAYPACSNATSDLLAGLFNERDEAVKWMIRKVIQDAHKAGAKPK